MTMDDKEIRRKLNFNITYHKEKLALYELALKLYEENPEMYGQIIELALKG